MFDTLQLVVNCAYLQLRSEIVMSNTSYELLKEVGSASR